MQRETLDGIVHDAELARDEAIEASDFGKIAALQIEWAGEEWTRAAQASTQLMSALFDVQSACWRSAEECVRAGLQPWAPEILSQPAAQGAPDFTALEWSPQALLQRTAGAWLIVGKACMSALDHDLADAP